MNLLLDQFETLVDAPNGIKKLRELILQLAVMGKLVPQDPSDEPASALLEKIKEEKERLVKEGKIKRQKPLPEIKEDEKPYRLPKGWEWTKLESICILITDGTHHTPQYVSRGIPFLSVKDVSRGKLDLSNTKFISKKEHDYLIKRCHPEYEDILLTKVGTTGIAKSIDMKIDFSIFVSLALLKLAKPYLFSEFIEKLLNSPLVRKYSKDGTEGVGNKNLVLKKIKSFTVPIPPLSEQKRIVLKVDRLMKLCDQLEQQEEKRERKRLSLNSASLDKLLNASDPDEFSDHWQGILSRFDVIYDKPENVVKLKQAILQLAVMGKLVPQDPADESASVLLEKIKIEKERLIKEGKIKKSKPLPEITEDEKPYTLPKGWEWVRFPETGIFGRGKSKHRPRNAPFLYENGKYPMIQTGDVARSNGTIKTYTALYNEVGLRQSQIWPKGTMCITIAANIADSGILDFDACFPDSVVGFVPSMYIGSAKYFEYFMRTSKKNLDSIASSTAQKNINLGLLNRILIPLPPYREMYRIVSKVDHLINLCNQLEKKLRGSMSQKDKVFRAIVQRLDEIF